MWLFGKKKKLYPHVNTPTHTQNLLKELPKEEKMFGDKPESKGMDMSKNVSTILDRDSAFEGKMTFDGTVLINGKFKGEIFSDGTLIIGEGGLVEGKIEIGSIQIQGEVRGNIIAKDRIEIAAPALVRGDIVAPSLIIKEGSIFEGSCSMGRRNEQNVVDFAAARLAE